MNKQHEQNLFIMNTTYVQLIRPAKMNKGAVRQSDENFIVFSFIEFLYTFTMIKNTKIKYEL